MLTGGELVDEDRCLAPTVIRGEPRECHTWKDEIFGPVATIHTFKTFDEALEMANDSRTACRPASSRETSATRSRPARHSSSAAC